MILEIFLLIHPCITQQLIMKYSTLVSKICINLLTVTQWSFIFTPVESTTTSSYSLMQYTSQQNFQANSMNLRPLENQCCKHHHNVNTVKTYSTLASGKVEIWYVSLESCNSENLRVLTYTIMGIFYRIQIKNCVLNFPEFNETQGRCLVTTWLKKISVSQALLELEKVHLEFCVGFQTRPYT